MNYILLYNDFPFNFYELLNFNNRHPSCIFMFMYIYIYIHIYMYIYIYIHTHAHIPLLYACLYICVYIYMYIYIYTYIYIYIHSFPIAYLVTLSISSLGCYVCIKRNVGHWWNDNWQGKTELNGDKTVPMTISVIRWKLTSQRHWQRGKINHTDKNNVSIYKMLFIYTQLL